MLNKIKFKLCSPFPAVAAAGAGAAGSVGSGVAGAAATWAPVAASGLDAIGGQVFGIVNLIRQKQMYEEQKAWQRYVYEDQKKLNDPAYIMERRRLAGLNPYGDFNGSMSTGQPSPVQSNGIGDAYARLAGSLSNSADKVFNIIAKRLERKSLELQEKKIDNEILLTDEQRKQLRSTTAYQDLLNEITSASKDSKIKLNRLEVEKMLSDILLNNVNIEWLPERLRAEIKKLNADANATDYNWLTYLPAMLALNQRMGASTIGLQKSQISLNEKNLGKIAEEIENLKMNGAGVKELKKTIDKMPDGIGKTFMTALLIVLQSNLKQ